MAKGLATAKAPRPSRKKPSRENPTNTSRRAARILDTLEQAHPEANCALHHSDAFQLLVSTILSAQCTDERVNMVTPRLFARFPTVRALASAGQEEVEEIIRSTGFFRAKSKNIIACARVLLAQHGGDVPRSLDSLVKLPGIGRKTASVVLGHAYGLAEGIAVDTHVLRVANRLGIARSDDAEKVEEQLLAIIPRAHWIRTTDLLIFHGRKICDARRPACGVCPVFALCRWDQRQAYALGQTAQHRRRPGSAPKKR